MAVPHKRELLCSQNSRKIRKKFTFGSWNVRTLQDNNDAPERKTAVVALELSKYNIDIAALSETRLPGISQFKEEKGGYVFFTSGKSPDEPRLSGVGFAVKSELASSLQSLPKGLSDRIMTLTLELELDTRVTLVSCYAPTMNRPVQEKDDFYQHLREVISCVRHKDKLILMGDFNARVGTDSQTWGGVLGRHGVGKMNDNGLRLLSLCREFHLTITNTVFQQKNCHKTTWMHPRSNSWHMIDYVVTKHRDIRDFMLTRSFHASCYLSDHALLRSKTSLCLHRRRLRKSTVPKRINVTPLKNPDIQASLSDKLGENLENVEVNDDIEKSWKALRDATHTTAVEVLGLPIRKHQDWFDDQNVEAQDQIQKMHRAHKAWIDDKNSAIKKKAYKTCKAQVQGVLRQMKEKWWADHAQSIQAAFNRKDTKAFYEGIKKVFGPQQSGASPISAKDGTLFTDKSDILNRWKEHFETVLNTPSVTDDNVIGSIQQLPEKTELSELPTLQEVYGAIRQIRMGKAPGNDAIPPEVFKYGGRKLVRKLHALFVSIWIAGKVPQDFKDASILHLYKNKGRRNICDNHRGISLLSIAGKILARLILNRLLKHVVDEIYPESQCGFRALRGTIDMIFSLRQVSEKAREKNQELYMVFIDLTKAFDTVNRAALWKIMQKLGIPDNMLRVITSFHEGMKASVVSNGDSSEQFNVSNGTKQGCVMAPVLFALFFSVMLKQAFSDVDAGVKFQFRTSGGIFNHQRFKAKTLLRRIIIRDLLFADDAALVATSLEEAQLLVDRFSSACKAFGLTISIKKTEVIHQPPPTPKQVRGVKQNQPVHSFPVTTIRVDESNLKYVKNFTYLGSVVNSSASLDNEIVNRISRASGAFGKLSTRLWKNRGISLKTKMVVYKAVILTTLLYASESWTPYRYQIEQLDVFHKRCLRTICGFTLEDRVSNADLYTLCGISGIEGFLIQSQLRWAGHVVRMDDSRIPKQLMYSQLDVGNRNIGRPWLRYKDKLKANLAAVQINSKNFELNAKDRDAWRSMCHQQVKHFSTACIQKLREARLRAKLNANMPATLSLNPHACVHCGLVCRSLAGLKCHLRLSKCRPKET